MSGTIRYFSMMHMPNTEVCGDGCCSLAARLHELGVDVDALLEGVLADDEEDNESEAEGPDLT